MTKTTLDNLQIWWNCYQIINYILHRTRIKYVKICMETQNTLYHQSNIEKKLKTMKLEESCSLTSDYTTKLESLKSIILAQK